ncbi:MAG: hypothetical protein ACI9J3_003187 [Parvicellaceae bacterium]|jgi:hypothetical protein
MAEQQEGYRVIITKPAQLSYYDILEYLYFYYSENGADEIARELYEYPVQLENYPNRGTQVDRLSSRPERFLFILYKRTEYADIKIIYFVDEASKEVYVTDFFPTEMHPDKIIKRK